MLLPSRRIRFEYLEDYSDPNSELQFVFGIIESSAWDGSKTTIVMTMENDTVLTNTVRTWGITAAESVHWFQISNAFDQIKNPVWLKSGNWDGQHVWMIYDGDQRALYYTTDIGTNWFAINGPANEVIKEVAWDWNNSELLCITQSRKMFWYTIIDGWVEMVDYFIPPGRDFRHIDWRDDTLVDENNVSGSTARSKSEFDGSSLHFLPLQNVFQMNVRHQAGDLATGAASHVMSLVRPTGEDNILFMPNVAHSGGQGDGAVGDGFWTQSEFSANSRPIFVNDDDYAGFIGSFTTTTYTYNTNNYQGVYPDNYKFNDAGDNELYLGTGWSNRPITTVKATGGAFCSDGKAVFVTNSNWVVRFPSSRVDSGQVSGAQMTIDQAIALGHIELLDLAPQTGFNDIAYSKQLDILVAVGNDGLIYYSTDQGTSFIPSVNSFGFGQKIVQVEWSDTDLCWLAVSADGAIHRSATGAPP